MYTSLVWGGYGQRAAREVSLKRERLLRTRQEVYHPLQEVCPLDRVNLLLAKLEGF